MRARILLNSEKKKVTQAYRKSNAPVDKRSKPSLPSSFVVLTDPSHWPILGHSQ